MSAEPHAEPWLREIDLGIHPALAQPIFALQQVREDVQRHTSGLSDEQIWSSPHGLTPLGFHLRHIAGSTDRLTTYLRGGQVSEAQLSQMKQEKTPGPSRQQLLTDIAAACAEAEAAMRALDPEQLGEARFIGRKRIRTTAVALAIHIGEHAQRHTGQAITTCHIIRLSPK
jgi:uncharacterized damage-inducible protein DinB